MRTLIIISRVATPMIFVFAVACGQPADGDGHGDSDEQVGEVKKVADEGEKNEATPHGLEFLVTPTLEPPDADAAAKIKSRGDGVFVKGDLVFRGEGI